MADGSVAVGDHVRPTEAGRDSRVPAGVYRVVGTDEDAVTLLVVGDAAGRRVHTGEIVTVACEELDTFELAENPDASRSLATRILSQLAGLRWSLWLFWRSIRSKPISGTTAITLLLVGTFGEGILPVSETVLTVLVLLGTLLLVYLGRAGPA
ncbi:unknown [Haloarcula marismortui ATCC 43049]|uniref:Uncharacterized protein n=1 Tax=Haloarcula marismortui (strain ATCC 43049 / DSM 3752 / JCM 8966 / VKM B-1809) TaxID=272569 RepID=Q5UYK3_HALMA|nr:hypothetical protein [Haloarcula marismortui]AAV47650.1 unknown [Haloarcula marismortui ATCC 43049]QCP92340.1 hypothetical protein E6P14_16280 [Haloarcula marismortui ATCC 43049]